MPVELEEKKALIEPKFRNLEDLPPESLTDPDYRLRNLLEHKGGHSTTCSRCHHCRR